MTHIQFTTHAEIQIRECDYANADDFNAIGSLINAYIADRMGGGKPLNETETTLLANSLRQHPKSVVLLALVGSVRCGMIVAFENFSTFSVRPMINIHDVIVLKEFRRHGIGRALMNKIISLAQERGCSRLTLEVREDNPAAQKLYLDCGFNFPEDRMYFWRKYL